MSDMSYKTDKYLSDDRAIKSIANQIGVETTLKNSIGSTFNFL